MLNCLLILTLHKILSVGILSDSLYPAEAVIKTDILLIIHTCPDLQAVTGGQDQEAVEHLFYLTSGLKSQIIGEDHRPNDF